MLKNNLMQVAVMGTLNHGDAHLPQALYHAAARQTLRQQAGFVIPCMTLPAPASDVVDERPVISENCLALLFTMFRHATHSEALPELLTHIVISQRRIPPEVLPELLAPGIWNIRLRQYFYAATGQRCLWLAHHHHSPGWTWIRRFSPEDPALLPSRDTWREKGLYELIADNHWVQLESSLQHYYSIFTADFASTLIQALGAACRELRFRDAMYALLWKTLAYRCPLSHYDELLTCVRTLPARLKFVPEPLQEILDFRTQMLKLVHEI